MLERLAYERLLAWKQQTVRKPLLLDGARQVGKSWLIGRQFGPREFREVHWLDFRANPQLSALFAESLDPATIIDNIEIELAQRIDIKRDLLFLDEVGECQQAVDALKYFAERLPQAFVCASGSNIGLLRSFPVGKVDELALFPLCFEEFLMAAGREPLLGAYRAQRQSGTVHQQLWPRLLDYYFVGGMPEAVAAWFEPGQRLLERTAQVTRIHRNLVNGYRRDFGKHAGIHDAQHIERVFESVPMQLAACRDGSVARYRFKRVVPQKQRYRELAGPIDWLEKARLLWKCFPVQGRPDPPLQARIKANRFRLYLFDVGLLGHMLGMTYTDQRAQSAAHKGYIAENFVRTELGAHCRQPCYGWFEARSQIEFLIRDREGRVIPVEVKSSSRTRARSLSAYIDRYAPARAIKLIGAPGSRSSGPIETWPLYHAQFLARLSRKPF